MTLMTTGLVSEARRIPWEELSQFEKDLIEQRANGWMHAALDDSAQKKQPKDAVDDHRSGRVLFINGPRGAGKTSLLLTLLDAWDGGVDAGKAKNSPSPHELKVFKPILDFDPMPLGMPLHAWLLEPWRGLARDFDKSSGAPGSDLADLTELLAELFERAVTGWTPAQAEGKSFVDKSLAYQDQASGWSQTGALWRDFVGAMLCRQAHCSKKHCDQAHRHIFIIAIDDVDLQVEQLPQLLHAIRLLHHPNVAYVLTGNYDHLKDAMELHYIGRHGRLLQFDRASLPVEDPQRRLIESHSRRLCNAFLEKVLPVHARLDLDYLTLGDILQFVVIDRVKVVDTLERKLIASINEALLLQIATARQAQHAVDRHRVRLAGGGKSTTFGTLQLLAELCETNVMESQGQFLISLRGELTTELGPILNVWDGDHMDVTLADRPTFVFHRDFEKTVSRGESERVQANQALFVQLLTETKKAVVVAHALKWTPEAGVATTNVGWEPDSNVVEKVAVFHWPWLVRPTAAQMLEIGKLARQMRPSEQARSLMNLKESMVAVWLLKNIEWGRSQFSEKPSALRTKATGGRETQEPSLEKFALDFRALRSDTKGKEKNKDTELWLSELYVMTTPYFGLPLQCATKLRAIIGQIAKELSIPLSPESEQKLAIRNAIVAGDTRNQNSRQLQEERKFASVLDLSKLTDSFLQQRRDRLTDELLVS